jgi:DNA-binding protein H-NS
MTPDAVASLYEMYASDLVEFKMINADGAPSRRYQWLFEKMMGRSQRLYSMREMQTATIAAKALDDLEKLIMGRKKMEAEYINELKEKEVMIKTLMNQLQEALEDQNHLLNKLNEFHKEKETTEGASDVAEDIVCS